MTVDFDRLRRHVAEISAVPRPAESPALEQSRRYVESALHQCGWETERLGFEARSPDGDRLRGINLLAVHPEHRPARLSHTEPKSDRAGQPRFCLVAHLDSVPDSPGADDNASAVAGLLEIARLLPEQWPQNPRLDLELLVTDLEEYGMLGGVEHVRRTRQLGVDLRGMASLEMIGYCDPRPGRQALPRSLVGRYPETGDFIGVIGNEQSAALLRAFEVGMRRITELPVETLLVPGNGEVLQATRLSDHSPFWDAGYAALMITDTSFLRNPHYHLPTDTPDTLDYGFLQRVTAGCLEAVRHILDAGLPGPDSSG